MLKRNRPNWLPAAITLGVLAIFAGYLAANLERYRAIFNLSGATLAAMVGLILAFIASNGLINTWLYRSLAAPVGYREGLGLGLVNTLANQLPFAGGLLVKSVYLKRRYRLAYRDFLSATLALYVCFVAANGGLGLLVLAYLALASGRGGHPLLWAGFTAMLLSISVLWIPLARLNFLPHAIQQRLPQLMAGWWALSKNLALTSALVAIQILSAALMAGRFWLAFRALSQEVTLAQCLLFSAATVLTQLVSIAPGGLGVREGLVAGMAVLLGFDPGVSAVAAGLDRLISTAVILLLGGLATYQLSKNVQGKSLTAEAHEPCDAEDELV
ncbi:MAG: flippase-like domain-containing protein [Anaerolineales bacterium]|nr:flippase-like domain-containing protein [Anaerolineales bacterium]